MTIKQKLLGCLALLGLATFLLAGAFWMSASQSETALSTVLKDRVLPLRDLKKVADSYAVNIADAAHKARNGNISFAEAGKDVREGSKQLHDSWGQYRATKIEGEEARLAEAAEAQMRKSDASVDRLLAILSAGDRPGLDRFVTGELYASIDPVSEAMAKLIDLQIDVASKETTAAVSAANTALTIMVLLAIGAALVLGFSYLTITRKVIAPIVGLASIIRGLAQASGEAKLPNLDQKDEIGEISRSVDAFLDAAMTKERATAAAAAAEQHIVTAALEQSLDALSKGDLTRNVEAEFPKAYAVLKTNFNTALVALRELIGAVGESASQIRTGSGEIAQASEDLARRTESNAASLEETSAALVQIDTRIKATAQAADRTVRRADQTISTVTGGRAVAEEAVEAMGRVSESAKGIDNVIEGLDKIAFQTRVLAMNAAVEAGRAGEAGRGFAVVADLVSALAMRAEEEAKRARDQLTVTQSEIVSAVDAVQKVDGALADISGDVGEVHQLLGSMASDNQAQASAITQISAAIGSMDQATQQNAAMVEQTSAAARNLTSEVETLADQAAQFRTGGDTAPRSRKASPPAAAPKHFVPAKPRTNGTNGSYVSPVAALPSNGQAGNGFDEWKDF